MWRLKWGAELKTLLEIQESTGAAPKGLLEKPELRQDCVGYLNTFDVLSEQRAFSEVGVQPIRISEVTNYLMFIGISGVERKQKFLSLILELDRVYMQEQFKKNKKNNSQG